MGCGGLAFGFGLCGLRCGLVDLCKEIYKDHLCNFIKSRDHFCKIFQGTIFDKK